ncbi:MAG: OB-fold domain-containing protein [Thermomicrobiales bacterium]
MEQPPSIWRGERVRLRAIELRDGSTSSTRAATAPDSALEWRPVKGTGVVHAFTIVYRHPNPAFQGNIYVVAMIELDEGVRMMSTSSTSPPTPTTSRSACPRGRLRQNQRRSHPSQVPPAPGLEKFLGKAHGPARIGWGRALMVPITQKIALVATEFRDYDRGDLPPRTELPDHFVASVDRL